MGWGAPDDPSEVALGGHLGWLRGVAAGTGDSIQTSHAITFDTRIKLGRVELLAQAFVGQGGAGRG